MLCRYELVGFCLHLRGSRAPSAERGETRDVWQVSDTRSSCCSGCKMGPGMGSGADSSGSASQGSTMALTQARHPRASIFTGESAPFQPTEPPQELHNFMYRYIICLCFLFLKSLKAKQSICRLIAYTHDCWLICAWAEWVYHSLPSSLRTLPLPGYQSWALQFSGWSLCPSMMSASSFLDALYDSVFFAINCDVLLEASIIDNENGHFGLSGVWQVGLFDLESYYQRDRK